MALSGLLAVTGAVLLVWAVILELGLVALLMCLVCAIMMLIWLWRARTNIEGLGPQRRAKGWVIGGWFCPVVFLWFPFQIVTDVALVDEHPARRSRAAMIRIAWWVCWLLAWVTGFTYQETEHLSPYGTSISWSVSVKFGGTVVSRIVAAAAAFLLALVVREITTQQHRRVGRAH